MHNIGNNKQRISGLEKCHDMKNIDVMNSQHTKVQWHIINHGMPRIYNKKKFMGVVGMVN